MQIYKTRLFAKWAKKQKLADCSLRDAVDEIEQGLVDADLGGSLIKKRVAIKGKGKRSGLRSLLAYQRGRRVFFIFGYAKNAKVNISSDELYIARALAKEFLHMHADNLAKLIKQGKLIEVNDVK